MSELRPYQAPHAEALLSALHKPGFPFALDFSDMGTGKTFVTCDLVRRTNAQTLVVCPKALVPGWHEVAQNMGTEVDTLNYEMLRTGRTEFGKWETLKRGGGSMKYFHFHPSIELLVFDEFQRCRGFDTLTHRLAVGAKLSGIPTIALTATPAETPMHCRALGYLSGWFDYFHFFNWVQNHNCIKPFGSHKWEFVTRGGRTPQQVMAELRKLMLERGSRIDIGALPPGTFPENIVEPRLYAIDNPDRVTKLYQEMAAGIEALRARKAADKNAEHGLTKLLRARQELSLLRVPLLKSLIQDDLDQGRAVVIFSNFLLTIAELAKILQIHDPAIITGDGGWNVPMPRRKETTPQAAARFQANQTPVCIAQSDTGGVGLSLHDLWGRQRVSYVELHWSAMSFSQIMGRIRRDGAVSPAIQRIPCIAGTPEEQVYKALVKKSLNLQTLLTDEDLQPFAGLQMSAGGHL